MYKFLIPLFALALLIGCAKAPEQPAEPPETGVKTSIPFDGKILSGKHTVILHTTLGDIALELDADAAPKTVTNFIALAKAGYYDALTFHRVIPGFMIQGGDPKGDGTGGESVFGAMFEDEINAESYGLEKKLLKDEVKDQPLPPALADASLQGYYELQGYRYNAALQSLPMARGAIAMANRGPNTNGSQFFIVQKEDGTPWLEGKHTVFGNVTAGLDVVDGITAVKRDENNGPLEPVTFTVEVVD